MKVVELRNLNRKEIPLSYRRSFTADAVVSGRNSGSTVQPVEFDLENTATGTVEIRVRVVGSSNYPVIPLLRELRSHISTLNSRGRLF